MDFGAKLALITGLFSLAFMLNLPMGYLRSKTKKLSFKWFVCVHLSIPFIYLGRLFSHVDAIYIPIFIVAALLGQVWGGKLEF